MDPLPGHARARLAEPAAIDLLASIASRAGLLLDFDGTLAPIQSDPSAVRPLPGVVEALAALVGRLGRVAVVSARPAAFLRACFGSVDGIALHGHYGLQAVTPEGIEVTVPAALPWISVLDEVAHRARHELPAAVLIEQHPLSVSLHYRTALHLQAAVGAWAGDQARRVGVAAQRGRMVVELRPPIERDKGDVVTEETRGLAVAWYAGDDISDLRAFRALAEREAREPGFVGVRVAVTNEETGHELAEAADFMVATPAAVPGLLCRLLNALG